MPQAWEKKFHNRIFLDLLQGNHYLGALPLQVKSDVCAGFLLVWLQGPLSDSIHVVLCSVADFMLVTWELLFLEVTLSPDTLTETVLSYLCPVWRLSGGWVVDSVLCPQGCC